MFVAEAIGNPECPLMLRWTLLANRYCKVQLHHFMPGVSDPDVHDHPRSFVTIVLRGSYDDMVLCKFCGDQSGRTIWDEPCKCSKTDHVGLMLGERMRAGMICYRHADHAHSTIAGPHGCWTICIMGPLRRPWGFWKDGRWWPHKKYNAKFGITRGCD